ncbi:hypothetical protein [Candidatus Uabimicrobium amorphum]|uniref:Sulfotransferase domain-containing protein n=1 Tax=Uabimicrobium amorphum TaxID=2596890 RepID=A0A5S9IST6_UABAM|nr:hypothetical protein [Candidatus Uabimicrobium amorphum]BBM87493.1 hypothetical protein UABAM_05905 [Candidatus Uabimicrobium amorphum]
MKRMVLHFGMNKTGSTSIQQTLYKSDLGSNWEYADLGRPNHSFVIQFAFQKKRSQRHINNDISESKFLQKKAKSRSLLKSTLESCKKKNIIVSGEGIFRLTQDELSEFNKMCLNYGFQTQIVGYLREPKSLIESQFQQVLKGVHHVVSWENLPYPDYKQKLIHFEKVFGRENVSYWLYDRNKFVCVVKDLLFRLGIKSDQLTVKYTNKSLSLRAVRFLYTYRKLGPALAPDIWIQKGRKKLIGKLRELKGVKLSFSKEIIDPILENNKEDITWANSRLDYPFPPCKNTDTLPGCINSELDLFKFDEESLHWLGKLIDKSRSEYCGDIRKIAAWMHILYQKLVENECGKNL